MWTSSSTPSSSETSAEQRSTSANMASSSSRSAAPRCSSAPRSRRRPHAATSATSRLLSWVRCARPLISSKRVRMEADSSATFSGMRRTASRTFSASWPRCSPLSTHSAQMHSVWHPKQKYCSGSSGCTGQQRKRRANGRGAGPAAAASAAAAPLRWRGGVPLPLVSSTAAPCGSTPAARRGRRWCPAIFPRRWICVAQGRQNSSAHCSQSSSAGRSSHWPHTGAAGR
mmetsp:Transcript_1292/g.3925  ORF Transcript_1292/g.3925 Transcript_1292/m.3925 type:complete len:228 (+) Transcript_1292:143-826(+)